MTTSSLTAPPATEPHPAPTPWANPIAQASVDGGWSGPITVTRALGKPGAAERVFVESESHGLLIFTREQAADVAEALHKTSGMATSTYAAQFLARAVLNSMEFKGVTRARICAETGITRHRLRRILAAEVPMTQAELEAISEVGP